MKKIIFLLFSLLFLTFSCGETGTKNSSESDGKSNAEILTVMKQVAALYHDLDAEYVDSIFTVDFVGNGELGHTWDRESHRRFLSNGSYKSDSIHLQVAEGEWVATMFSRTMDFQGERITVPVMHFKRFEGNKIAEVWEYYDYNAPDPEEE